MLSREAARRELAALDDGGGRERAQTRLKRLPRGLRSVGSTLLGSDPRGPIFFVRDDDEIEGAWHRLDDCGVQQRTRLFAALFPAFPEAVEAAWQGGRTAPYQSGHLRRSFRAPGDPEITLPARGAWLMRLLQVALPFERDLAWFAAWAPYLPMPYSADTLGRLFAAAIDRGGDQGQAVYDILADSAAGRHPVGHMGRHVSRALLCASSPAGWSLMERLLLAAQRQEGLRQVILETIDEAHPEAFARMVRLLRAERMTRFAATVRAVAVWFGFELDTARTPEVDALLDGLIAMLGDANARRRALAGGDAPALYLALWAGAFEDAQAAVALARPLLGEPDPERCFAAVHLLAQLAIPEARSALLPLIDHDDLRVALRALDAFAYHEDDPRLFEPLVRLLERTPRKAALPALVWPWTAREVARSHLANRLAGLLGVRSAAELFPYLEEMDSDGRGTVAHRIAREVALGATVDGALRDILLHLVGDVSQYVRRYALEALGALAPTPSEAPELERLLTRKTGDLRRGVISLLRNQPDDGALASAERLLASTKAPQRQAGLELLRELVDAGRNEQRARALAESFRRKRKPSRAEADLLAGVVETGREIPTLDDGLGLFDPAARTPVPPVRARPARLISPAAPRLLQALDELIHEQRETPVQLVGLQGESERLLGNLHSLWQPVVWQGGRRVANHEPPPLAELWLQWWQDRPAALRDDDGLELPRSLAALHCPAPLETWPQLDGLRVRLFTPLPAVEELGYRRLVANLLGWLAERTLDRAHIDLLLDGAETTLALLPKDPIEPPDPRQPWFDRDPRNTPLIAWLELAREARRRPEPWTPAQEARLWRLLRFCDEGFPGGPRRRPLLDEVVDAWRRGDANEHDLLDQLVGPRPARNVHGWSHYGQAGFHDLRRLSGLRPDPQYDEAGLQELVERVRARILEVESTRGDLPSAAAEPALALRSLRGARHALTLLRGLGRASLVRGYSYDSVGKASVYSHLLRVSFPAEDDTPERFAELARELGASDRRLLELAMYAPQWARFVEHALGWPGLEDAGLWLHAHTKDTSWTVDRQVREVWVAEVSERTPLSAQHLLDGAVDVAWFRRVRSSLTDERWRALYAAAKYASGGGGHKRAQLFADALDGSITPNDLLPRIENRRHQDAVRALGLLPLPPEGDARQDEILRRYRTVQDFVHGSRDFGAQRRASERLAADIALDNLARSAGYDDPQRLVWAMEAREIADLAAGPLRVVADETQVTLRIDDAGEPQLEIVKGTRALKRVPARLRKRPEVAALLERSKTVAAQAARMRSALEETMVRGDPFRADELGGLLAHPVLRPQLSALVLVTEGGSLGLLRSERALTDHDDRDIALGATGVRVAHPVDLLHSGAWERWQRLCFARELRQPFKQVFRELYLPTASERAGQTMSERYGGHQLEPRRALALFGRRGWVAVPDEGVRRTFHREDLSVHVGFLEGSFTPADVDGLTLDRVMFTRRGSWEPLQLASVPARVFSEVMRDLDLVVSVAHRGGVDPEASHSTVEMRGALLRETAELLALGNVRLQGQHALIDGRLGSYSVHLGSAVAHRQPGGALFIVPVHSQQRGRLFLPFADDDPRTAEVVSKVVLLARDQEIRDPTILEQLR